MCPRGRVGRVSRCAVFPFPSSPSRSDPQHRMVPSASTAQVWLKPAETDDAVVIPVTGTGVELSVVVPFPSSPESFTPQHVSEPAATTAHVWWPPAERAAALVRPVTATGRELLEVEPFPSCP